MTDQSIYRAVLLDHFHNPRNKGDLGDMQIVRRGSNPRCGDEIEIGINCENNTLESVRFRGRGCSICLASASLMTESARGLKLTQARDLIEKMQLWFGDQGGVGPPGMGLAALGSVRQHPARKKCVLLAWQALDEILDEIERHPEIVGA
ncbi:MAG: SUF system NifU family Fe-S cluster assembly protein [Gammaproteobacteria bacterium]|nr:SUF system NifU family Fe-S cluster assembly protein [Gammaproteobacteria bacterium]MDH3534839.1 SUF system NifU family Fe-S cluster assembly protein [Gammaproteobacteria bacterium]